MERHGTAAGANGHAIWSRHHHARWLTLGCVLLLSSFRASAQTGGPSTSPGTGDNPWFVRGGLTPAFVISDNPFSSGARNEADAIDRAPNATIEVGRRANGTSTWHELYGMPSYGFGFSLASFRNGFEHARPVEVYGFFSWPFFSFSDRLDVTTDFGTGVSWNWKRVNDRSGTTDTVLGSNLNARIDWGFYLRYLMTPRQVLYTGVDFTHRSNGGVVQPDIGINTIGPKVMLQYNFGEFGIEVPSTREARPPSGFEPSWDLIAGVAAGLRNVAAVTGRQDVLSIDMTGSALRRFYPFGDIALGTDVVYGGSAGGALGIYGGYEHVIGRFSAFIHFGYNVARALDDPDAPHAYQRFGWRYQVNDRIFGTFDVRAVEGRRAEALEVGAGYRLRWPLGM